MTDNTQPEALPRYKIGYPTDGWGVISHTPTGIPDPQGAWVRYGDAQKLNARIAELESRVQELGAMARENRSRRIVELEAQLDSIRAGGVSGPLMGQPQEMPDLSALTERGAQAWAGVDAQGLRDGFTAADMATAAAQGLRDGVASVAASVPAPSGHIKEPYTVAEIKAKIASNDYSAEMLLQHAMLLLDSASLAASVGSELVYQARYQKGFWQDSSRERYEYLQNPENTCAEDWETRILYTHTSPPEGMAVTDAMIDAGKKMLHNSNGRGAREKVERIFNAMLEAAPPTTPAGSGKGE